MFRQSRKWLESGILMEGLCGDFGPKSRELECHAEWERPLCTFLRPPRAKTYPGSLSQQFLSYCNSVGVGGEGKVLDSFSHPTPPCPQTEALKLELYLPRSLLRAGPHQPPPHLYAPASSTKTRGVSLAAPKPDFPSTKQEQNEIFGHFLTV